MKRKRLTIIFFSIMTLAATPQAMNQFNSYSSSLVDQAEAEWLYFLTSFGSPVETQENTTAIQNAPSLACSKGTPNEGKPATLKSHFDTKANTRSVTPRKRKYESSLRTAPTASLDISKSTAPDQVRFDLKALANVFHTLAGPDDPNPGNANVRTKAAFLKNLIRSVRIGDSKTKRVFPREMPPMIKPEAAPVSYMRASRNEDGAQRIENVPDPVAREATDCILVVEKSMH